MSDINLDIIRIKLSSFKNYEEELPNLEKISQDHPLQAPLLSSPSFPRVYCQNTRLVFEVEIYPYSYINVQINCYLERIKSCIEYLVKNNRVPNDLQIFAYFEFESLGKLKKSITDKRASLALSDQPEGPMLYKHNNVKIDEQNKNVDITYISEKHISGFDVLTSNLVFNLKFNKEKSQNFIENFIENIKNLKEKSEQYIKKETCNNND